MDTSPRDVTLKLGDGTKVLLKPHPLFSVDYADAERYWDRQIESAFTWGMKPRSWKDVLLENSPDSNVAPFFQMFNQERSIPMEKSKNYKQNLDAFNVEQELLDRQKELRFNALLNTTRLLNNRINDCLKSVEQDKQRLDVLNGISTFELDNFLQDLLNNDPSSTASLLISFVDKLIEEGR